MSQPPYHLRQNKAVDRLIFVDAIQRLWLLDDLSGCIYHSFGGPYLEDLRLIYESFPEMSMVSIERDAEIYKRQDFHLPCGNLTLCHDDFGSFLATYDPGESTGIFWLDYTGLEYAHFEQFLTLLQKVNPYSMIKLTVDASTNKYFSEGHLLTAKAEEFKATFDRLLPDPATVPSRSPRSFAATLQDIVRVAAEKALPGHGSLVFQPISSFFYADGHPMLTVTGIVCLRKHVSKIRDGFVNWQFANLNWGDVRLIDLPNLTTKERLHLQRHLPVEQNPGASLTAALGYLVVEDSQTRTEEQLAQYAEYHRYSPYFIRSVP